MSPREDEHVRAHGKLTLRPLWPEDAPALAVAIGYAKVATSLSRVPHPLTPADAAAVTALPRAFNAPGSLIVAHESGEPTLTGGVAMDADAGSHEFGYRLTPAAWARSHAAEAGRAVVAIARPALRLFSLRSSWLVHDPTSGPVPAKLGLRENGRPTHHSLARGPAAEEVAITLNVADAQGRPLPIPA